jgi:hypothetical protein
MKKLRDLQRLRPMKRNNRDKLQLKHLKKRVRDNSNTKKSQKFNTIIKMLLRMIITITRELKRKRMKFPP